MSNLELNQGDNFIFGMDVSGSMQTADCPGGMKRIDYLKEKVIQFAGEASKYDSDGIDVITFGHQIKVFNNIDGDKAKDVIAKLTATESATMTHELISKAWEMHKTSGSKQTVLFIATDGDPSDREAVKKVIRGIAAELPDGDEDFAFSISILTVGNIDGALQSFLTDLDDNLKAKHDIVDVKRLDEVDFISAFAGALHD